MTRLKSTLLALSLLTASPAFAQTNITGDWDVTVNAGLPAGRAAQRHHPRHAGLLRADHRLRGGEDPALQLREVPARGPHAHHDDARVGEVMAIGRTFHEAYMKALRSHGVRARWRSFEPLELPADAAERTETRCARRSACRAPSGPGRCARPSARG